MNDLLEDVRLIEQSNPDGLIQFAKQWQTISGTLRAQGVAIDRALIMAQADAQGATAQQLIAYRAMMTTGVSALATGSGDVAAALREIVPKIRKIHQDMDSLLGALTLSTSVFTPESWPATLVKLLKTAAGSVNIMNIVNLVNDYHVAMDTLATALSTAGSDFLTLDALQGTGGAVPAAPHVTP